MRMRTLLYAALVSTCAFYSTAAAVDVSGTISTTNWTKANSPYRVTAEVVVPTGETLTIEPGVDVLFDANVHFLVQGTLVAIGTETDSIRFMKGTSPVWNRLRIFGGTADLRYVRISDGRSVAGETESPGGGIFADGAMHLTLDHCVINNNVSEGDGGGLALWGGTATVTRTTICDNVAIYNGGGITVGGGIMFTMTDCLIARNDGGVRGGGINASRPSVQILVQNCTIADNKAGSGSGVWAKYQAVLTLINCIVWGNAPSPATFSQLEGVVNASYSDIEIPAGAVYHPTSVMGKMAADVYAGVGNINAAPEFLMPSVGDYRLAAGSPCVNAGDPATPNDADGTRADMGVRPGNGTLPQAFVVLISTDTTWVKSTGPFHVSKPVVVAVGATLTIEPGVDVLFDAPAQMVVSGRLEAVGTAEDSIRFLPGLSAVWGGLRFASGDSSTLAFARVSGVGNASDGMGGVFVTGAGTRLRGSHVVISGNESQVACGGGLVSSGALLDLSNSLVCDNRTPGSGGGLLATSGATLSLDRCGILRNEVTSYHHGGGLYLESVTAVITGSTIAGNKAAGNSGGIRLIGADLTLANSLIAGNSASKYGGGIWMSDGSTAQIENCTITDNTGMDANTPAGGIGVWASVARLKNTIVWGNATRDTDTGSGGAILASYCDLGVTLTGTGNINADPLFVDPANQNFHLQNSSPCIDAGDPSSPKDPDGTRADIGMRELAGTGRLLALPRLMTDPGASLSVPVRASFTPTGGINFAFVADASLLTPADPFVTSVRFGDSPDVQVFANIVGDTVFVSLSSSALAEMSDDTLMVFSFTVASGVTSGTVIPLRWVPYPVSNIGEMPAGLVNGRVQIGVERYGDVTDDGTVSAQDASQVLKFLVRLVPSIIEKRADVTGNGYVSAQDAYYILRRALDPALVFPVEEQEANQRPGAGGICTLSWVFAEGSWNLVADRADAIESGELTLIFNTPSGIHLNGGTMMATRWVENALSVAFVTLPAGSNIVLAVTSADPLSAPPEVRSLQFNEGALTARIATQPHEFSLEQNTPNPFNPSTTIRFALPEAGSVTLAVYDVNGRLVRNLAAGNSEAGQHSVVWDGCDANGRDVASGVYVYRLTAPQGSVTRRMVLAR